MAQSTISIRVDDDLKKRVEILADPFGMNLTTLVSIFLKTVEREHRIPFEITARDDPFFTHPVNKRYLDEAFGQYRAGKTTRHDLLEAEDA